jgi:hypothetical protein
VVRDLSGKTGGGESLTQTRCGIEEHPKTSVQVAVQIQVNEPFQLTAATFAGQYSPLDL